MVNKCIVCGKEIPLDHACICVNGKYYSCLHHERTGELEKALDKLEKKGECRMKVYTQRIVGGNGCIHDNFGTIEEEISLELDELYYNDKTEEEKMNIKDNILYEIKNLKVGEKIEALGFEWGLTEMAKEEIENLDEFTGW